MKKLTLNPIKNERGQGVIEAVLIMVILFSIAYFVLNQFESKNHLQSLVKSPWKKTAGMIESGVWVEPNRARSMHPNQYKRQTTLRGDIDL